MPTILAMSEIAAIKIKGKSYRVYIRERKGRHQAPYIVLKAPDNLTVHIHIDTGEFFDNDGLKLGIIKEAQSWVKENKEDLMLSWKASDKKALRVPIAKGLAEGTFKVRRVKEIKTTSALLMLMRMDDGEIRVVDFKKIIPENESFKPLKNPRVFMQAEADGSGIRWESLDIDMEVASLYDDSDPVDLTRLAKSWKMPMKNLTIKKSS